MTVALIYFFFLSLQVTNSPSVQAVKQLHGAAGEDISVTCGITFSGTWKVFCREDCRRKHSDSNPEACSSKERYSIECVKHVLTDTYFFSVNISNLHESDSGLYRCGLGNSLSSVTYQDFRLVVPKARGSLTSSSGSVHSNFTSTATLEFNYSSGSLTPSASSETTNQSVLNREEMPTSEEMSAELLLVVGLAVAGILLSGVLLVFCSKRCQNHQKGTNTGCFDRTDQQGADYENYPSGELIYQNVKPVDRNMK